MKSKVVLATLAAIVAGLVVLGLHAGEPAKKADDKAVQIKEDLTLREQILARQFQEFLQSLLKLQQRLERSPKQEDRDRAVNLKRAIEKAQDASIATQFDQLVDFLKTQRFSNISDVKEASDRAEKLATNLRELLAILREDSRAAKLREERERLQELIKALEKVIHDQKVVEGQTRSGRTDKDELHSNQVKVTNDTRAIGDKIDKHTGGEAKNTKGQNKDGKGEGKKGEAKDVGKSSDSQKAQGKEAGKSGDPKGGAKGGEAKSAGAKSDQAGESKSGKGGDANAKSAKGGDPKSGGEAKSGGQDGKDGQEAKSKDAGDKSSLREKSEAKGAEKKDDPAAAKKGDPKDSSAKAAKSGEQSGGAKSGGDPKQGEAKSGSSSSGQSSAKSSGEQKGDEQQANSKSDPKQQQAQQNAPVGKQQIQDAQGHQHKAEDNIAKKKNQPAGENQIQAIEDLEKAKKKLEELLRQLREEELERLLAALIVRCERMLAMQIQVLHGTEQVAKGIDLNPDKKANRQNQQDSLKLSDDEKEIVLEASKAIEMLEAEGSAVAFPEVFQQVREDMKHVQRRLGIVDVGQVTQAIEKDIIDTLKEMIEALKKARQELDNKKNPPNPNQSPPQDQKLLDKIAELKMIRSMQLRVNGRTRVYGEQYQGEQASDPGISRELRNLSDRQERIFEVTNRIAKGDNQ